MPAAYDPWGKNKNSTLLDMGRRRAVVGLKLDLTRIPASGDFVVEDLIVHESAPKVNNCDLCKSYVVGAFRECDGRNMCGLCCAIYKKKITNAAADRLKQEYAKPCPFCGDNKRRKNFDHINMFTKEGCVGFMVETGQDSDKIIAEIDKCQLLCVTCHYKVTTYEQYKGFFGKKRRLNRKKAAGQDISDKKAKLMTEYAAIMEPFYRRMVAENIFEYCLIYVGLMVSILGKCTSACPAAVAGRGSGGP